MKILLVDDDRNYQEIFRRTIDGQIELTTASTLAQAKEALRLDVYDCVVLDLKLPDSEPEDTVRDLKQSFPAAVCVAISGNESPQLMAGAIRGGAHGYLHKGKTDLDAKSIMAAISDAITHKLT